MTDISTRPKVNTVFTPRNAEVNASMYISRPAAETELKRSVEGSLHTVLCGESGSGKSWLYRYVSQKEGWLLVYANAGNGARCGSLAQAIAEAVLTESDTVLVECTQTLAGKIGGWGFEGGGGTTRKFEINNSDVLKRAFSALRTKHKDKTVVLVVDNLEAIFSKPQLMEELGNIVLLLDDPDYAKYKIKLLLVGVPTDIIDYFQETPNLETVANRLKEIPALYSLTPKQIAEFIRRGFIEQLKVALSPTDIPEINEHVGRVTLGIPQRLHEYCEELAYRIEEGGWRYEPKFLQHADNPYLQSALRKAYAIVEGCMNGRKTKAGRRNQVLYSLGKISSVTFDYKSVESVVRTEFPTSTHGVGLGISQTLSELSDGAHALLRRNPKAGHYRFADPRYLMCLRIMLTKSDSGEKVLKKTFRR